MEQVTSVDKNMGNEGRRSANSTWVDWSLVGPGRAEGTIVEGCSALDRIRVWRFIGPTLSEVTRALWDKRSESKECSGMMSMRPRLIDLSIALASSIIPVVEDLKEFRINI